MYIVQCPHCQRKFKVSAPVSGAKMKCSQCGEVFVGSSVDAPDAAASDSARPTHPPTPGAAQTRRKSSNTATIMLICFIVAVVGIIAMGIGVYYRLSHPTVEVRDTKTGQVVERGKMEISEAERKATEIRTTAAKHRRRLQELRTGDGQGGPAGTTQPRAAVGDPKLRVSTTIIKGGVVGDVSYVCGRVLSRYTVPLKQITVTVHISGSLGPSQTYQFIPAEGEIRYCISLGSERINEDNVKVVAGGGKPVSTDTIVWVIKSDQMQSMMQNDKVIWSGRTRNRSSVPVKNVRIYCDFFDDDGIQGGSAVGKLEGGRTIGAGKSASFRVELNTPGVEIYRDISARAVGQKY